MWRLAKSRLRRLVAQRRAFPSRVAPLHDELEHLQDLHWKISDSARRYRELLDAQAGMIVRRDATGRITFANRAYLDAFGLTETDIAGRFHWLGVLQTETPAPAGPDSQTRPHRIREHIATPYGPRWIEWEEIACTTASSQGSETQRTGRDITEQRRVAEELRTAHDAALAASRAKSRFLAAISHEIRTPMNGIIGMTDLLLATQLNTDQATYARAVEQSARSLMSLIDEILDFSKIEAGKLVLSSAPFSIVETVESCIALLEPRAIEKGIALGLRIEGDAPPLVAGDEARVRQILLNLLSNAVKFTDYGSVGVALAAMPDPATGAVRIRVAVTDTGIGLSAADREAVFAEFEQAEAAVRRHEGGSGLGLAISLRIARAMDGDITVVSEPGRGSTFTTEIVLDRAKAGGEALRALLADTAHAPVRAPSPVCPVCPARAPRVLLAEDNAINALLATLLLEREGCCVERVRSGDEAVAAVARTIAGEAPDFDLVLMDIYMPRLDGIETTRAIRRLMERAKPAGQQAGRHDLPIVAVTANAFPEDRQQYLAAGLDDYLAKPFDARELKAVLSRWLAARGEKANPAA